MGVVKNLLFTNSWIYITIIVLYVSELIIRSSFIYCWNKLRYIITQWFHITKKIHVNLSYEHHFFRCVLYMSKPTTKIPSNVLLNSPVSDMTLTSEGGVNLEQVHCFHSAEGKFPYNYSYTGDPKALCNALEYCSN